MADDIQSRLQALGLELPDAPGAIANYVPWQLCGAMLYISGQISRDRDGRVLAGQLGSTTTIEQGRTAARWCALSILAQAKSALGNFDRIAQIVRLTGFVAATPEFRDHPQVLNGASDLFVALLGDKGRHTRAAVGVASLPLGAAVEIDAIIRVL